MEFDEGSRFEASGLWLYCNGRENERTEEDMFVGVDGGIFAGATFAGALLPPPNLEKLKRGFDAGACGLAL